jgi:hypothetical protein
MSTSGALSIALTACLAASACTGGHAIVGAPFVARGTAGAGGGDASAGTDGGTVGDVADAASSDATDAPAPVTPFSAAVVTRIPLPGTPTAATYNAGTKKAYFKCLTAAQVSAGIAVVDDTKNAVVANIPAPSPLTALASNATTKRVYGVVDDSVLVIDSAADTVTTTVPTPDHSMIVGLTVDELHDQVFVISKGAVVAYLYAFDGKTNSFGAAHQILLNPVGTPPLAVDGAAQKVFILGADSNMQGEEVTVNAMTGTPVKLTTTDKMVSPSGSGIVALGDGTAALVFVSPGFVKVLEHGEFPLPATFTPTSVALLPLATRANVLVLGFGASGEPLGYTVDPSATKPTSVTMALGDDVFKTTTIQQVVVGASLPNGAELYLDAKPGPDSTAQLGPAETVKIALTR